MSEDIAIAHKDYDTRGGGEVFCRRLAHALDAPLYVGRRNQDNEPDDPQLDIREIPLNLIDKWAIDRGGLARTAAYALRWQAAADVLANYDVVITSGNEPLWYVPPDEQTVIAYTHSTPRFMYDLYNETMEWDGIIGRLATLFNTAQRTVYESNVRRPDVWVCNSDIVARRVQRYWNIPDEQIRVVYPPVNVRDYDPGDARTQDFYLHLGRIAGHKRVGSLIDAWEELDVPLKIAGTGPEKEGLEKRAPDSVEFLGYVDEARKRELMAAAKAHVYPCQNEDFGMVPVESMAAGTPVIGVDEGFTKYQILEGRNGYTYEFESGELGDIVRRFERDGVDWDASRIATFADRFNVERFEQEMLDIVDRFERETEVRPDWIKPSGGDDGTRETLAADGGGDA